ncbi:MAG: transcription/translation regulatory transformer protein RfaH [Pseudomonadota bacterium]
MDTDLQAFPRDEAAAWYLVQCKPRQDERAEDNLMHQGYHCYRPQRWCERTVRGQCKTVVESLFPGYLFIYLAGGANWAPLRSTRGVNRVVGFGGGMPLRLDSTLIAHLKQRTQTTTLSTPPLEVGDNVRVTTGNFASLDAIFMAMDGEQRVILLLNMLNRQQQVSVPLTSIVRY